MAEKILLLPVLVPIVLGILILLIPSRTRMIKEVLLVLGTLFCLLLGTSLFRQNLNYIVPWAGSWFEFSLRLYHFSAFILLATAGFGFLIALYSCAFMPGKKFSNIFYSFVLISIGLVDGAVLADNLLLMLFFWEGLLVTLFVLIAVGNKEAYKTATKAFIIVGISDLCMMAGIALTAFLSHTFTISQIKLPVTGLGGLAFILLMIGAISKAGSMPFHSWIPDAALDAPLPFMAILPASLEKLLGIYFLARISLDLFQLDPRSGLSILLMVIGGVTILLAVMMALIQKDYKKLLSYHAISQVGYMIMGIGTFVPAGIVGGLFHMINHAMYKSCLFLTGGAVEKQAGTTNLEKLGGLVSRMPVTFICFFIAAAAISGVPPFNGFFSKELVYDGALERGWIFYAMAVLGSFFTAASFLKLGHSAFLGPLSEENRKVKEASLFMLLPMMTIAGLCVLFGVNNSLPLKHLIQPILGEHWLEGRSFAGWPGNSFLVMMTLAVLTLAFLNHVYGVLRTKKGIGAVDHIYHAPVLSFMYDKAEKRYFDPYDIGLWFVKYFSRSLWFLDRANDFVYNEVIVKTAYGLSSLVRSLHNGKYSTYIIWSLMGSAFILFFLIKGGL